MKDWYRIQNSATEAVIRIDDYIGRYVDRSGKEFGVSSKQFIEDLAKLPSSVGKIRVDINSPGGAIHDGLAITNALRAQRVEKGRTVETVVDGIAASIASVIAMAGQPAKMADNALLMIHLPWSIVAGNEHDLRTEADVLVKHADAIITSYRWHTTLPAAAIRDLMTAETWMTADEAIGLSFVDEKTASDQAAAKAAVAMIGAQNHITIPDAYRAHLLGRAPTHRDQGWSNAFRAADDGRIVI